MPTTITRTISAALVAIALGACGASSGAPNTQEVREACLLEIRATRTAADVYEQRYDQRPADAGNLTDDGLLRADPKWVDVNDDGEVVLNPAGLGEDGCISAARQAGLPTP